MVAVDEQGEVVLIVLAGKAGRLHDLAFLLFPITHEAEYPVILPLSLQGRSHAHRCGQPLTEITRVPFHAGHDLFHVTRKT